MGTLSTPADWSAEDDGIAGADKPPTLFWKPVTRILFRFCFVYLTLYAFAVQMAGALIDIPGVEVPDLTTIPPLKNVIAWTATHVFRMTEPLVITGSGSGDKRSDWVMSFCFLVVSVLAAAIWSVLDRRRLHYAGMLKWFRLFLRFCLAGQMLGYGVAKVVPLQMSFPALRQLLQPYGTHSPMGILWEFIGSSPSYEMLCGAAEVIAAILLFIPRFTLLGALVTAGVTMQIFILNMTYDVPVKLFSFHLWMIAVFLIAPELSRLSDVLVHARATGPSRQPALFKTRRSNRIALVVQILLAAWLVGHSFYQEGYKGWFEYGGGAPRSALYGIWDVERLWIDGQERSALIGDYGRWRRVVFERPDYMRYQRMDDTFDGFDTKVDEKTSTMALTNGDDKKQTGKLHYVRVQKDQLNLDGVFNGHSFKTQMRLLDREKFELVRQRFHWVQEYPFNR